MEEKSTLLRRFLENRPELSFNLDTRIAPLQHAEAGSRSRRGRGGAGSSEHYESLLRAARLRDGSQRLEKVEGLRERGRRRKKKRLLQVHQEIWHKEWNRLQTHRVKVERDLQEWRENLDKDENTFWREFFSDAAVVEELLRNKKEEFVKTTVKPLLRVRGSIRAREMEKLEEDKEEVKRRADEGAKLIEREFEELWCEVEEIKRRREESEKDKELRDIPVELFNERKGHNYEMALKELQLLDDHYSNAISLLRSRYLATINNINGGWSLADTEKLRHIVGQYPSSLRRRRRRSLLIDRLEREFPHLRRQEIIEQETWNSSINHYNKQLSCLKLSWNRNRIELVRRLVEMLKEEREVSRMAALSEGARLQREEETRRKWARVCAWRREKEEAAKMEELERETEREREEEERVEEERKMAEHREQLRAKVDLYHCGKWKKEEEEREEEERRKEEKKEEMKKERLRWRERVDHRQDLLRERQRKEEKARERAMAAVQQREERLEQIRKTVEVRASHNPLRLLQSTKASQNKFGTDLHSQELHIQHPLFTIHGYRDNVVTSDPRFRVAAALNEAGLLGSKYARAVLANIPPSHPPRQDQTSTILK